MKKFIKNRIEFLKKNIDRKSLMALIIFLIIVIVSLSISERQKDKSIKQSEQTEDTSEKIDAPILASPVYTGKIYFGDIEDKCPPYEPDGVSYRNCLSDFVAQQMGAMNYQFATLVKNLQETVVKNDAGWLDYAIEDINEYKKAWDSFIYKKCRLESIDSVLGSGRSEEISLCVLGEVKYLSLKLNEIDKEYNNRNWSDGSIID